MNLLPIVKNCAIGQGFITEKAIKPYTEKIDSRLKKQLNLLPKSKNGLKLEIEIGNAGAEKYFISISADGIKIKGDSTKAVFYAIITLRQIFAWEKVPFLQIEDYPDFKYRGVYHDVTRGKVPKLSTLKKFVDTLAYYKINSLQLYVEHAYNFKQVKSIKNQRGYLTANELKKLDKYCKENFIEFIPSIATFGHMYEILQIPEFNHLRVLKDYVPSANEWKNRMDHHTVDPTNPQSEQLVASLIDQYMPNFTSEYFNICGDETFDLRNFKVPNNDQITEKELYVEFINKIIKHVKSKGKRVMMWADILLKYPETINLVPDDTIFLNWDYSPTPWEGNVETFKKFNRSQIVCPGTWSWNRLIENFADGESNISKMAEFGYKYGAMGVLNTNWGDWGNPCSIELAMYGLTLGAEKAWSATTQIDQEYYNRVGATVYGSEKTVDLIKKVSELHKCADWPCFCNAYSHLKNKTGEEIHTATLEQLEQVHAQYNQLKQQIQQENIDGAVKQELLIALDGICLITELSAKLSGIKVERLVDTYCWIKDFKRAWLKKNKKSELNRIVDMFRFVEEY